MTVMVRCARYRSTIEPSDSIAITVPSMITMTSARRALRIEIAKVRGNAGARATLVPGYNSCQVENRA